MATKPKGASDSTKRCFVICPIGDEHSETRERSDQVLEFIIAPTVEAAGYEVLRADKLGEPGIITHQIIELLQSAELVVADLTGHNPNVMYELAIRHAVHLPLVQMIATGERIPFDVASSRTITFDWRDMRSADTCKRELATQIQAVEKDPSRADNPISAAITLVGSKQSGDRTEVLLVHVIEQLQVLGQRLTDVERSALRRTSLVPGIITAPNDLLIRLGPSGTPYVSSVLADTSGALNQPSLTDAMDITGVHTTSRTGE